MPSQAIKQRLDALFAEGADLAAIREEFEALNAEEERRLRIRQIQNYKPYPKQRRFHDLGLEKPERLFMAGNQIGKTTSGAAELTYHLTGAYPDWWAGRRFAAPIVALAGSETAEVTRRGIQRLLLGPPEDESQWGTGFIPGDKIVSISRKRGVADTVEAIVVRHRSGGNSIVSFKSYDQGRRKWQADTVHVVWFDEEPPYDVYSEGITRTNATRGLVYTTFTPLLGRSTLVMRFMDEESPDRAYVQASIDDAEHLSVEDRHRIVGKYNDTDRDARAKGIPTMGSGRVFPIDEERIIIEPFEVPRHFAQIVGLDFGYDHPFAASRLAFDRDNDVLYVTATYRQDKEVPAIHVAAIRPWGTWIPVAWPHDGFQHDKGSGDQLAETYREQGLNMLANHATHAEGGFGVEAGILEILERMQTGRFKVFRGLDDWLQEFRSYHREKGVIVKLYDDLLAATRYAVMMRRYAETEPVPTRGDRPVHPRSWMS